MHVDRAPSPAENERVQKRFETLLERIVEWARITCVRVDPLMFRVPREDGAGNLLLADVGMHGVAILRIAWMPPARSEEVAPIDLTDVDDTAALRMIVGPRLERDAPRSD